MKKNPYKFTIQFNPNDPRQKEAAEILNAQSKRGKALVITNALLERRQDSFRIESGPPTDKALSPGEAVSADMTARINQALDMFE